MNSFSPMMIVSRSEVYAAIRLLQYRYMGISMDDIFGKLDGSPQLVPDLSREEFMARKKIIVDINRQSENSQEKKSLGRVGTNSL